MLVIWMLGLNGLSSYCLDFQEVSAVKNKNKNPDCFPVLLLHCPLKMALSDMV